nr:oxidoreductase, short chain [Haemonchus contortus]
MATILEFQIKHDPYYAISKAGLDQFTRALAVDLIEHGVRVNGVRPGIVETSFMENNGLTKEQSEKVYKFYGSQRHAVPRGSNANPLEIANVIAFLADRKMSSYIVGQMIVADGGTSLIMGAYTYDFEAVLSS